MSRFVVFILAVLPAVVLSAGAGLAQNDNKGCKDHPLLTRMPGFYIANCEKNEFEQVTFKNSKGENIDVEGYKYFIGYALKPGAKQPSELQIYRNHENALKSIGSKVLHKSDSLEGYFKLEKPDKNYWVLVYPYGNGDSYQLTIVEEQKMVQAVVAEAESMKKDIALSGHVTVHGIHFDFNKASLKPESKPALDEVAKLLKITPGLKLFVVGHTDNKGSLKYNLDLSRKRAHAVVKKLVQEYAVSKTRLDPHGAGPLCPVLSNRDEAGRSKNRRVELVEK
jgi:OOP family OmpA-OmpF porin